MAWGTLQPNQWISYIDIQDSGLTLRDGQLHVNSNQWMTKTDINSKFYVDASALSSFTPNQWPPKSNVYATAPISCATSFTVAGPYVEIRDIVVGTLSGNINTNFYVYNDTGGLYNQEFRIEIQYEGGAWVTVQPTTTVGISGQANGTVTYNFLYNTSNMIKIKVTKYNLYT